MMDSPTPITRRSAFKALAALSGLALAPQITALAVTQDDIDKTNAQLSAAQSRYNEVNQQLQDIGAQFESLSQELSQTLEQIDGVNEQIEETEAQVKEKTDDLAGKRERLAQRVRSAYKSGGDDTISAILNATSFEELSSSIYYMDKITGNDRRLIDDVEALKDDLEAQEKQLEESRTELEGLREDQQEQLKEMQAKQQEVMVLLDGLDEDVKKLMSQRDDQIMQLSREREEQKKREEAARRAAQAASPTLGGTPGATAGNVTGSFNDGSTTGSQQAVISACHSTPSPGPGYCAAWVSDVFANAGLGFGGGNADDMYYAWTTSSDRSKLKPGMIVAVSTHSHTVAGSIYGHIGIYIGGGVMMDNVGYIRTISVNEWIDYYSTTVTVRWGWFMGIELA